MPLAATRYEAESAALTNVTIVNHGPASNYAKVGNINYSDSQVNFNTVSVSAAGTDSIRLRYDNGNGSTGTQPVSINGGTATTLSYPATRDWGNYGYIVFNASLNALTNSISFGHGTGFAELDAIEVYSPSTRYEAESATLNDSSIIGGALRVSSSGGAQVGYINNADSSVNAPTAGTYTIRVRYSNGSGATSSHSVSVNGGTGSTLSYAATTDWGD